MTWRVTHQSPYAKWSADFGDEAIAKVVFGCFVGSALEDYYSTMPDDRQAHKAEEWFVALRLGYFEYGDPAYVSIEQVQQ